MNLKQIFMLCSCLPLAPARPAADGCGSWPRPPAPLVASNHSHLMPTSSRALVRSSVDCPPKTNTKLVVLLPFHLHLKRLQRCILIRFLARRAGPATRLPGRLCDP
ncbi:uncharacterized protein BKA78DRAFT_312057 [Phyllosticta capitalensis]|uniref:uncharacterized protein n=1 Tax=Phyllosticta capitalensis TaxID=121624 RepID=UPI003130A3C1